MATKAELFRYIVERSGPKRPPRVSKEKGTSAERARHRPTHIESRAAYVREKSRGKRPSRKSTRRSKNRQKPESQLARRQGRRVRSPKERATRA